MEKIEIKEGHRYGIGVGYFHVQKDHGNGWFDIVGKRRSDSKDEFYETWPEEVILQIARAEKAEKKIDAQRKSIEYWKQKDENKKPILAQLNQEVKQLKESNQELLGAKNSLEKDLLVWSESSQKQVDEMEKLNKTLSIAENLNQKLEVEILDKNIEIEDVKNSLKFSGILSWVGWVFFLVAILGMIFI